MTTSSTNHSRPVIADRNWRKALGWMIAELLAIKVIALVAMKLLFFQAPVHALTARDVASKIFPGRASQTSSVSMEKPHD